MYLGVGWFQELLGKILTKISPGMWQHSGGNICKVTIQFRYLIIMKKPNFIVLNFQTNFPHDISLCSSLCILCSNTLITLILNMYNPFAMI